ncbi:hypothetical protein BSZ39_07310 [Bowdeniella nasicola]|uniref:Sulfatase N-terminal domain-containing protein n=1 Tax=Bowdeniella nasicola TaxID=208480 RepID=A0A1Q5Q1X7_9ACTO|nr:hypothetical protein BSZ39_07310 [Bowdeniella nasicola]
MLERYAEDYKNGTKPFFLASSYAGPHLPYVIPDEYFDVSDPDDIELPESIAENFADKPTIQQNYSDHWAFDTMTEEQSRKLIAVYWGYVTMLEREFKRILDALERFGLTDNAAVVFSSDHGEFTGSHRLHYKGPAMYEDIYRTGGIIRIPGCEPQVRNEFVSLLDLTATFLDIAGLDTSPAVDFRSLVPIVRGEKPEWPETILCEFHGHHFPVAQRILRGRRYKLVINPESRNEFYDLKRDPNELKNRYNDPLLREVRDEMMRDLYDQLRERGDSFYHWMTSMFPIRELDYDPTMSGMDESTYRRRTRTRRRRACRAGPSTAITAVLNQLEAAGPNATTVPPLRYARGLAVRCQVSRKAHCLAVSNERRNPGRSGGLPGCSAESAARVAPGLQGPGSTRAGRADRKSWRRAGDGRRPPASGGRIRARRVPRAQNLAGACQARAHFRARRDY